MELCRMHDSTFEIVHSWSFWYPCFAVEAGCLNNMSWLERSYPNELLCKRSLGSQANVVSSFRLGIFPIQLSNVSALRPSSNTLPVFCSTHSIPSLIHNTGRRSVQVCPVSFQG